jgi:nucleoside-diphosphate-sugar epimerase
MRVLVTGGAGFLGRRLIRALLDRGTIAGAGGPAAISRIVSVDVATPDEREPDDCVEYVTGDLADTAFAASLIDRQTTSVFHLAAVVSGMAEADFDLGWRVNLDATRALLEACRAAGHTPRLVFASSVAVFGGDLPAIVPETWAPRPQSSYGAEKAIGELLVCDYSRKGYVDGRVLRLPTISVRPGRPNAAASSFASGIIREPLKGEEAICPVGPDTRVWLLSPATAIACLITGHELAADAFGPSRIVNLPGLATTAGQMASALGRAAGQIVAQRITWQRDPRIEKIVTSWPGALDDTRARALGFPSDDDFEAIIRRYMSEST